MSRLEFELAVAKKSLLEDQDQTDSGAQSESSEQERSSSTSSSDPEAPKIEWNFCTEVATYLTCFG
jgi:hypothetical protein